MEPVYKTIFDTESNYILKRRKNDRHLKFNNFNHSLCSILYNQYYILSNYQHAVSQSLAYHWLHYTGYNYTIIWFACTDWVYLYMYIFCYMLMTKKPQIYSKLNDWTSLHSLNIWSYTHLSLRNDNTDCQTVLKPQSALGVQCWLTDHVEAELTPYIYRLSL